MKTTSNAYLAGFCASLLADIANLSALAADPTLEAAATRILCERIERALPRVATALAVR